MTTAVAKKNGSGIPTIRDRLKSPAMEEEIAKVVPRHVTPRRMIRVALTALTRTPKLAECDQASFFRCLFDLSQWGLEPDGRHAHLIPFRNNKRNVTECQLIIDYKGFVQLAYRSGSVHAIHADVVRKGDQFVYDLGLVRHHTPWFLRTDAEKPDKPGDIIAAYCHVELADGVRKSEVLSVDEVNAIRERSNASSSGPWVTDWNEMAKKTAFRRIVKWIPISAELHDAVAKEDELESIIQQPQAAPVGSLDDLAERLSAPAGGDDETVEDTAVEDSDKVFTTYRKMLGDANDEKSIRSIIVDEIATDDRLTDDAKLELEAFANQKLGK